MNPILSDLTSAVEEIRNATGGLKLPADDHARYGVVDLCSKVRELAEKIDACDAEEYWEQQVSWRIRDALWTYDEGARLFPKRKVKEGWIQLDKADRFFEETRLHVNKVLAEKQRRDAEANVVPTPWGRRY